MNLLFNNLTLRLMALALIVTAIAGCNPKRKWEIAYFEIEAKPIKIPIAEYDLRHPVDGSFKFGFRRVIKVNPPNATPPQKLAVVYSEGSKDGEAGDCTGFFISKRDFLTARHCVPLPEKDSEAAEISVSFGQAGNKPARCFRSGQPPGAEDWKDWAICSFGEDLNPGDSFTLTTCPPKPQTKVMIMGFCELIRQEGTPYYTYVRAATPNAGVLEALSPVGGFLPAQPLDGETTKACPLDSGGPAFIPESLTKVGNLYTPSGSIRVFGIISGPGKCPEGERQRTCIAPTTDTNFLAFLEQKKAGTITLLGCDQ